MIIFPRLLVFDLVALLKEYKVSKSPRLKIIRLEVRGNKGCKIEFKDGINVIRGDNSLGKTTAIKLIHYALGSKKVDFVKEIDESEEVILDLTLNEKMFQIRRRLRQKGARVQVYPFEKNGIVHSYYTNYALGNEFSDFLLHHLGIPIRQIPVSGKKAGTTSVSFLELYRLMYVSQDLGGTYIQEGQRNNRMQQAVLETALNLSVIELLDLEIELSVLEAKKKKIKEEIDNYNQFIQELGIPHQENIEQRIKELGDSRQDKLIELQRVKQTKQGSSSLTFDLQKEVIYLNMRVAELTEEISFIAQKITEYRFSRNDARNELSRLQRLTATEATLSSFTFSRCPRCSQTINDEMKEREKHDNCMLCGRSMLFGEMQHDVAKHIGDIKDEIHELNQLIEQYEIAEVRTTAKRDTLVREKEIKDKQLDERLGDNYTSAFIAGIEILSGQIASIDEKINQQRSLLSIWERLAHRYDELELVKKEIKKINQRIDILRDQEAEDIKAIHVLGDYLHDFLVDIFRDYSHSKIDQESYLPLVNDLDYQRFSMVQKSAVVIAYHYALLRYSINHDSNYPRFLIIDTPNKGDMDPDLYHLMMEKFVKLKKQEKDYQLIIATREVPENLLEDTILNLEQSYLLRDIQLRFWN